MCVEVAHARARARIAGGGAPCARGGDAAAGSDQRLGALAAEPAFQTFVLRASLNLLGALRDGLCGDGCGGAAAGGGGGAENALLEMLQSLDSPGSYGRGASAGSGATAAPCVVLSCGGGPSGAAVALPGLAAPLFAACVAIMRGDTVNPDDGTGSATQSPAQRPSPPRLGSAPAAAANAADGAEPSAAASAALASAARTAERSSLLALAARCMCCVLEPAVCIDWGTLAATLCTAPPASAAAATAGAAAAAEPLADGHRAAGCLDADLAAALVELRSRSGGGGGITPAGAAEGAGAPLSVEAAALRLPHLREALSALLSRGLWGSAAAMVERFGTLGPLLPPPLRRALAAWLERLVLDGAGFRAASPEACPHRSYGGGGPGLAPPEDESLACATVAAAAALRGPPGDVELLAGIAADVQHVVGETGQATQTQV
eukprot:364633-Chlamydomonas_euryale.AAC.9